MAKPEILVLGWRGGGGGGWIGVGAGVRELLPGEVLPAEACAAGELVVGGAPMPKQPDK